MDENTEKKDITGPDGGTHEADAPPSNPETDDSAVEQGRDKLDQAGAGH